MPLLLNIDTATEYAGICLSDNGNCIGKEEHLDQKNHAAFLQPAILKIMEKTGKKIHEIDAVAVTGGPGSYTGIRVGMSSAKGLCFALNKPLIVINTLIVIAQAALKAHWVPFFNRLTPFVVGPEKGAKMKNTIVMFGHFYKVKRGYYHTQLELITTSPNDFADGQLTKIFAEHVERAVRLKPANYLWSHRRWKWEFDQEKYGHLLVK